MFLKIHKTFKFYNRFAKKGIPLKNIFMYVSLFTFVLFSLPQAACSTVS